MTTQNRPPPSFQEYAASMLANNDFRMMSLSSRGLLYTLRLEYWLGNPLPADPLRLGRILGFHTEEIKRALSELGGLVTINDGIVTIPELADYRKYLEERRNKQSVGGKAGAEIAKRNKATQKESYPMGDPQEPQRSTQGSLVQQSPIKPSTEQPNSVINEEDDWVQEFDQSDVHGYSRGT